MKVDCESDFDKAGIIGDDVTESERNIDSDVRRKYNNSSRKERYKAGKKFKRAALEAHMATLTGEERSLQQEQWRLRKQEMAAARKLQEQKVQQALDGLGCPLRIAVDCSFADKPGNDREIRSLLRQIEESTGLNRQAERPAALYITGFRGHVAEVAAHATASGWRAKKVAESADVVFEPSELVMLSPDAEEPLERVDPGKVYCIGGIVDRTVKRGTTLQYAASHGIPARRLPIKEHLHSLLTTSSHKSSCLVHATGQPFGTTGNNLILQSSTTQDSSSKYLGADEGSWRRPRTCSENKEAPAEHNDSRALSVAASAREEVADVDLVSASAREEVADVDLVSASEREEIADVDLLSASEREEMADVDLVSASAREEVADVDLVSASAREEVADVDLVSASAREEVADVAPSRGTDITSLEQPSEARPESSGGFTSLSPTYSDSLPFQSVTKKLGGGEHRLVLNINDVVTALLTYHSTGDWAAALRAAIPDRKVFALVPSAVGGGKRQRRGRAGASKGNLGIHEDVAPSVDAAAVGTADTHEPGKGK
ncbi:hypothetical protein CEUSTIGMA_g8055.t1 [Chlamydomonas eustigma]|uniref:tRNA (guanine(9)-N(1))-methyltransferase n=1 Tax=Chlamydomonas eustigma TaxID=1157962 RepID=A0A250XCY4_9CHLO|nr:hypothetical protein CEUSTIGMA_g8055.t1 [Chlamydomonas eustigma]|eukprot:GAX80620.1 hypothetical protein CEUSTIGMA_g8055.t1 [Chlamydomonas eustigma]